jgi:S-adenosylmethionine uptake transporter
VPARTNWRGHAVRGAAGIASMLLFFAALAMLPVSTATALNGTSGLFLPLLAWVVLAERPARRVLAGVAAGFSGMLLLVGPHDAGDQRGMALALLSGLLLAVAHLSIRSLGRSREPVLVQVFAFNLFGTAATGLLLAWAGELDFDAATVAWGVAIAAAGTIGQLGLVSALAIGPAAQVAALGFVSIALAACADFALFGAGPPPAAWPALALVAVGAWLASTPARMTT